MENITKKRYSADDRELTPEEAAQTLELNNLIWAAVATGALDFQNLSNIEFIFGFTEDENKALIERISAD